MHATVVIISVSFVNRTTSECAEVQFVAGVTAASGAGEAASTSAVEGAGVAVLQLRNENSILIT